MSSSFPDHFSAVAGAYADFRPRYPDALFDWLAAAVDHHRLALDVATGSGQAVAGLVDRFTQVLACDASAGQLAHMPAWENVETRCEPAEQLSAADDSVDLLTVAQALHWFDHPRFFAEAMRVLRPGGVMAAWCYQQFTSDDAALDLVLETYYHDVVGAYWPPQRAWVEQGYATLDWPFAELPTPAFTLEADWSRAQLLGYLGSWSATRLAGEATGRDPRAAIVPALERLWPDGETRRLRWPLKLRAGRKGMNIV